MNIGKRYKISIKKKEGASKAGNFRMRTMLTSAVTQTILIINQ